MRHEELAGQLDAYLDGELAPEESEEFESHLRECDECARVHESRMALRAALRQQVPRFRAPDALRERVRGAVGVGAVIPIRRRVGPGVAWRRLALAASLAVVAVGSWQLGQRQSGDEAILGQLLASHVRSLMPGHLTDVVSSDQHTVKPWFNGKLDYSPPVSDFAASGFPLLGGRLDYVGLRSVAVLVYGRRQHVINVFLWPVGAGPSRGPDTSTQQGYHLLHWTTSEYSYFVLSDLGLPELDQFRGLIERGDPAAAPKQ